MNQKDFPVEFATSLEVAGPTQDGMIHITFTRHSIGTRGNEQSVSNHDGYKAEMAETESVATPVSTIIFPYSRFKSLGRIFTTINEQIAAGLREAQAAPTVGKGETSSESGDDGEA